MDTSCVLFPNKYPANVLNPSPDPTVTLALPSSVSDPGAVVPSVHGSNIRSTTQSNVSEAVGSKYCYPYCCGQKGVLPTKKPTGDEGDLDTPLSIRDALPGCLGESVSRSTGLRKPNTACVSSHTGKFCNIDILTARTDHCRKRVALERFRGGLS